MNERILILKEHLQNNKDLEKSLSELIIKANNEKKMVHAEIIRTDKEINEIIMAFRANGSGNSYVDTIVTCCANYYKVEPYKVYQKSPSGLECKLARQLAIWFCCELLNFDEYRAEFLTLAEIGFYFGGISHDTIIWNRNQISSKRKVLKKLAIDIEKINVVLKDKLKIK